MDLKLLAISDTHLGEDTSLLDYPEGRHHLLEVLRGALGHGANVGELILVGDIPDRTLSSTREIERQTSALSKELRAVLRIERVVYLPGNHDHTLWSDLVRARSGGRETHGCTSPSGLPLVERGVLCGGPSCIDLLRLFFPHDERLPLTAAARPVPGAPHIPDFVIANPLYVPRIEGLRRTYVFTHGTHFRHDVDLPRRFWAAVHALKIDRLANLDLRAEGDVRLAASIEELEAQLAPFVDSLWPSSGSEPVRAPDELWFLLTVLSGKFGKHRAAPLGSRAFEWFELASQHHRFRPLTDEHGRPAHGSLERFVRHVWPLLPAFLDRLGHALGPDPMLIYGDTHEGGWGELKLPDAPPLRVFNTGSWVVHGDRHHPPCHLFAVDAQGEERFFDLSFAGVMSGGESLLDRAGRDVENRKAKVGHLVKWVERAAVGLLGSD